MTIQIHTPWSNSPVPSVPMTDEQRHLAFSEFVVKQTQAVMPWLLPLLNQANATVWVSPRFFSFSLPSNPQQWFEVTQMDAHIAMVPWAEAHETPQ